MQVFVASIHANPNFEYPYCCGFIDQTGGSSAKGSTLCLPLPPGSSWSAGYKEALSLAIESAVDFGAKALVVSLGVDTLQNDPVAVAGAGFALVLEDFYQVFEAHKFCLYQSPTIDWSTLLYF